jgi:hypothetical protein
MVFMDLRRADSGAVALVAGGVLGFLFGLGYADWQWAVEHAQVLAGVVTYPPDSPVAIAHAKLWSLTSQIGAALLSMGVSEIALSKLISGVMGLVSFQAIAAIVYALSRDALLAVGGAFVVFVSGIFDYGPVYPVDLLGTAHTHGVLGLSVAVLAVALIGMGWYRAGGFVLAIAPAVHLALGGWMVGVVAVAALASGDDGRAAVRAGWRWFAAGAGVAAVSYAIHRSLAPEVPPIDPAEAERYLRAFVPFWDGHRQAVDFGSYGVRLSLGVVVLAFAADRAFLTGLTPGARLLLRATAIGGVAALGLAAWAGVSPATLPDALLLAMPGRLVNATVLMGGAIVIGLAGTRGTRLARQILLLFLVAGLLVSSHSLLWDVIGGRRWRVDPLAVATLVGVVLLVLEWLAWRGACRETKSKAPIAGVRIAIAVTLFVAAGVAVMDAAHARARRADLFRDRTNDPVFAAAAAGQGPLLTAGELFLIQARSRRPVLLDGGTLDTLPYALEQGPAMDRILKDVYGVDLFHPPPAARGGGRVPHEFSRRVWEAWSLDRWRQIGRIYGVSQVIAPADWKISLPRVEASSGLVLYTIPR